MDNWEIIQLYAQNELISNVMPATGLKIVGTGACLPWCSISFSSERCSLHGWIPVITVQGRWQTLNKAEHFHCASVLVITEVYFVLSIGSKAVLCFVSPGCDLRCGASHWCRRSAGCRCAVLPWAVVHCADDWTRAIAVGSHSGYSFTEGSQ